MVVGRATRPGRFTSVPLRGALFLCVRTRVRDEPSLTAVSSEGVHAPRRLHALHATLPACVAQLTASTCPQPHRQSLSNLRRVDLGVKVGSGGGQGQSTSLPPGSEFPHGAVGTAPLDRYWRVHPPGWRSSVSERRRHHRCCRHRRHTWRPFAALPHRPLPSWVATAYSGHRIAGAASQSPRATQTAVWRRNLVI